MTSITASASARHFDLAAYAASRGDLLIHAAPTPAEEAAALRAAKRKAKHEAEMLALEYSRIMLEKSIADALDPATDPRLRRDLRNDILARGIGRVPENEDENRKKSDPVADAANILDFLAEVSRGAAAVEQARKGQLAHDGAKDITPLGGGQVFDAEQFLQDVEDEGEQP